MSVQTQFPKSFKNELARLPIPANWMDVSWGNDACPSFEVKRNRARWVCVWIDAEEPSKRELGPGVARFTAVLRDDDSGESTVIAQSDSFEVISREADAFTL